MCPEQESCESGQYPSPTCALHAARLEGIEQAVRETNKILKGNGDPSKGFIIRLDRLEQKMVLVWGAVGATFLALAALGWKAIAPI